MGAAPVHQSHPAAPVAEEHQVLAEDAGRDRALSELPAERHRVPVAAEVLPGRSAGADAGELFVRVGGEMGVVAGVAAPVEGFEFETGCAHGAASPVRARYPVRPAQPGGGDGGCIRIRPSCATEAIMRPSRSKIVPRANPRAPPAEGLSRA